MLSKQILGQIRFYENQIENCRREILKLENDYETLGLLAQKYVNLRDDFGTHQTRRKESVFVLENMSNMHSVLNYCGDMYSLLCGREFSAAYNGISDAVSKIKKAQREIEEKIQSFRAQITAYNIKMDRLACDYRSARLAEMV